MKKLMVGILLTACSIPVLAESKLSGELLLGKADQKSSISGFGSTSGDDTSIGVRGAYQLSNHFSLELAYHNYGESEESYIDEFGDRINDKVESTALNFGIKGTLPFDGGFAVYGRAGLALWDVKYSATDSSMPGEVLALDDDGNDFYYGVGVSYNFTNNFFIGAEYTVTEMDVSIFNVSIDHEVKNLSLSLGYRF